MNLPNVPPALLLMAEYNGTLAAARCLSRQGVEVTVATANIWAAARWSNAVAKVVKAPSFNAGPGAITTWLIEYGKRHPGTVLYPTCDEMAWLISRYRDDLAPYFCLYSPPLKTLLTILDKRDLYSAAEALGIHTPRTSHPRSATELAAVLAEMKACIVKPRSQAFFKSQAKGAVVTTVAELKEVWEQYRSSYFAPEVIDSVADIGFPMVQEYLPGASKAVYSISGFVDRNGNVVDCRASSKILQLPPKAGIGVCFSDIEPNASLVKAVAELCKRVGYYGVFEAEFVAHDGRDLLIDFNPRYFGQMAFDIARGMALPWLAHLAASGSDSALKLTPAVDVGGPRPRFYIDRLAVRWHLLIGSILGAMARAERVYWRQWLRTNLASSVDPIFSLRDMLPAVATVAGRVWKSIRHPRGFWRTIKPTQ